MFLDGVAIVPNVHVTHGRKGTAGVASHDGDNDGEKASNHGRQI